MSGPFRNSLVTLAVAVFATSFGCASATALTRKVDGSAQGTRHPNLPESTTGQKTSKLGRIRSPWAALGPCMRGLRRVRSSWVALGP